jgi:hypothetical protein
MLYAPLEARWLARWIAGSTIANLAGGGLAAALVAAGYAVGAGSNALACLAIGAGAGALAGIVIGRLQAAMLPPQLTTRSWLSATVAGAVIVWMLVAITPTLLAGGGDKHVVGRIALAMNVGAAAGMLFGAFQAPLLAILGFRSRRWLLATSAGWGSAAAITYVAMRVPTSPNDALVTALLLAGMGGLASGATTAFAFRREALRAQLIGQSTGRTCATELV